MAGEYQGPSVTTFSQPLIPVLVDGQPAGGGLETVAHNEIEQRRLDTPLYPLHMLTNDDESANINTVNARIIGAEASLAVNPKIYTIWFDEQWSMLHPDAYTSAGYGSEVLKEMYQGEYKAPEGTLERLIEHHVKYGKDKAAIDSFVARFAPRIEAIQPDSVVNWQDYFFLPLMQKYTNELRAKECFQTYHHHMSMPAELYKFDFGKQLLRAMSQMDEVYVHTDVDVRRVQDQLTLLGLSVPTVRRFDLGVDKDIIATNLSTITRDNYKDRPEYFSLSDEQKGVVDEIFTSQGNIPFRFITFDRLDPQKGTSVLLDGVESYLNSLDLSQDQIREQYRFFFVMQLMDLQDIKKDRLGHQYTRYVNDRLQKLQTKYPGVIFACPSVPRSLLPSLMKGNNIMTGGLQDGLNLAIQEGIYTNALADEDVNAIIGQGAGFAMQTLLRSDLADLAFFPRIGNSVDVAEAINGIVQVSVEYPGELGRRLRELSDKAVAPRNDTVFVRPRR